MTQMSETQRAAIIEAHEKRINGGRGMVMAKPNTLKALNRKGWTFSLYDLPTRSGLIAAGVDMDAIHEEAWREDQLEHLGETIVEHDGKRMMIKDIPDGWVRRQLGYGHESDHERSVIPVAGREWKATPDTCTYGSFGWEWVQHEGLEYLVCPRCGLDGT